MAGRSSATARWLAKVRAVVDNCNLYEVLQTDRLPCGWQVRGGRTLYGAAGLRELRCSFGKRAIHEDAGNLAD